MSKAKIQRLARFKDRRLLDGRCTPQTVLDASAGTVARAGFFSTCFRRIALLFARSLPLARWVRCGTRSYLTLVMG